MKKPNMIVKELITDAVGFVVFTAIVLHFPEIIYFLGNLGG